MDLINSTKQMFQGWFDKNNNANFLFVTAAIGWGLASLSQTFGLIKNKELTKEDKRFLIPQEIADGVTNIGMYALVTTNLMNGAKKLLEPGKNGTPFIQLKDAGGNILDYASNSAKYAKMGRNMETGAAIVGGIISTCILTPILRNAVGAFTKNIADKKNPDRKQVPVEVYDGKTQPYFTQTYPTPFQTAKPAAKSFSAFTNRGGMKI